MATRWRLGFVYLIVGALLSSCGTGTDPRVPTNILIGSPVLQLSALGQTQRLGATVTDMNGQPITDLAVTWRSSNLTVASVTNDGVVTANAPGSAYITANVGPITASVRADVEQVPAEIRKISGDLQSAVAGAALALPLVIEAVDATGHLIAGASITFTAPGNATFQPANAVTGTDGRAQTLVTVRRAATFEITATAALAVTGMEPAAAVFQATGTPTSDAQILIQGDNNPTVIPGSTVTPLVRVTDGAGNGIAGIQVRIDVTAGGGTVRLPGQTTQATSVVGTSGTDGAVDFEWVVTTVGQHRATASAVDVPLAGSPAQLFATVTTGDISLYNIDLRYLSTVTPSQAQAFAAAERRWEELIVGDVGDVNIDVTEVCDAGTPDVDEIVDDLLILVDVVAMDGPGGKLADAGPCRIRTSNKLPVVALMRFDVADLAELESESLLEDVILHEMGHAIGIGTIWGETQWLKQSGTSNPYFNGPQAISAFNSAGGTNFVGQKVPVENTGGAGTANSHWRESVLNNELMTGFIDSGNNPLSAITVRSLDDIGYEIDVAGADDYNMNQGWRRPARPPVPLHDDVWRGRIQEVAD